eukprot:2295523-Alexandrium_andersonii.AAC.1
MVEVALARAGALNAPAGSISGDEVHSRKAPVRVVDPPEVPADPTHQGGDPEKGLGNGAGGDEGGPPRSRATREKGRPFFCCRLDPATRCGPTEGDGAA